MEDRDYLDPEDMTPKERLNRIAELLAIGSIRLAEKERAAPKCPIIQHNNLSTNKDKALPSSTERR